MRAPIEDGPKVSEAIELGWICDIPSIGTVLDGGVGIVDDDPAGRRRHR